MNDKKQVNQHSYEHPNNKVGLLERDERYKRVYREIRDHYAAGMAYAAGNKWAEENFRALNG